MYRYTSLFYLQDEDGQIWGLGEAGGQTQYSPMQIVQNQCGDLINSLFGMLFEAYQANSHIAFTRTEKTRFQIYFEKVTESEVMIYLWVGQTEPDVKIVQSEYRTDLMRDSEEKVNPCWLYQLSQGSQFFIRGGPTLLVLLNKYVKHCSKEDHTKVLSGEHFLRFMVGQADSYRLPSAAGLLVELKKCNAFYQKRFGACPKDKLICEITSPFKRGYFFLIDREKWLERGTFTESDVEMI